MLRAYRALGAADAMILVDLDGGGLQQDLACLDRWLSFRSRTGNRSLEAFHPLAAFNVESSKAPPAIITRAGESDYKREDNRVHW
jgi:hypothetical protein